MIYNSFNFILIYPLLFLLYYAIPQRYDRWRNIYLLLVSYALYIQWSAMHALFLMGVTIVTYVGARILSTTTRRKAVFIVSLLMALAPLTFFKYFHFVNETIANLLAAVNIQLTVIGGLWAIPIGISFFTFQAIGYLADVYLKRIEPERDFLHYALFISFFPSILSGPINKASLILPQIKNLRPWFDYPKAVEGLKIILWGMVMKVVVADRVALYADTVLNSYENYTGMTCFLASVMYSIQIYADFAGYSLMALGVGKTLGFDLTENFRRPYFAVSVTDFWHRWHISLSTWLKDYVYIPLGGSRCSKVRNYWNIFITFLVSGIWHGANWTFIIWGIFHGIAQIVEKMLGQQRCEYGRWGRAAKILITFLLVNFAWIFFRMPTIGEAVGVITRIFDFSLPMTVFVSLNLKYAAIAIAVLVVKDTLDEFFPGKAELLHHRHGWVRWTTYIVLLTLIMMAGVFGADQFIYANF